MEETSNNNKDKVIRLIDYLTRIAFLRTKIVKDLAEYAQVLWIDQIPREKCCFTRAWGKDGEIDQDIWVEVQSIPEPELPQIPENCQYWINQDSIRNTNDLPELLDTITRQIRNPSFREGMDQSQFISKTEQLADHQDVKEVWEKYVEQKWMPWAEQHENWEKVYRVYSKLFAIHYEQLRLGEEYELVLGLGLLSWQTPSNQRVRRHLVVANALLEFEARLGKFTVRPNPDGTNLRPELDMLDIEEQPDWAEESAKSILKNASDDPWNRDCVENVLKALVHSISPDGEYFSRLNTEKADESKKPTVEYAPVLILRKHSIKGLTDVLKRIKERIESEEEIPPEFCDLAEIPKNDGQGCPQDQYDSYTQKNIDIYFPKPSNEEQRKIVEKIYTANGVLVQGPPGTGKSHTIANLICHLLATGQRALITSKTPRALQVLERLLPEELRPLCINLLGSGLEEKRSLESSVNAILLKSEQWNESHAQNEIKKYEEILNHQREEKARIEKRLRAIRESEAHTHTVANSAYCGTAAQIARALTRDEIKYGWFIDNVPFDMEYPLQDVNLSQLLTRLRLLTAEKRQELEMSLPTSFPNFERFKNLVCIEQRAKEKVRNTLTNLDEKIIKKVSRLTKEVVVSILDALEDLLKEIGRLKSLPSDWICSAVRDVLSGNVAIWQELNRVSEQVVGNITNIAHKADDNDITLPETKDQRQVFEDALILKEHLENGGRLGWGPFRPKVIKSKKYILNSVRINGCLCNESDLIRELVDVLRVKIEIERGWKFWISHIEKPQGPYSLQFQIFRSQSKLLAEIIALDDRIRQCRKVLVKCGDLPEPVWHDESCIDAMFKTCVHVLAIEELNRAILEIEQLESSLSLLIAKANTHPFTKALLRAIKTRSIDDYVNICEKINILKGEKESAYWIEETLEKIKRYIPYMVKELLGKSVDKHWDDRLLLLPKAWCWAQARTWLNNYINKDDAPSLARRECQLEEEIGKTIAHIASMRAWSFCFRRMQEEHRRNMEAWRLSMKKLGKGTGKHAPWHRREAQKHLNGCREAVPAWVMPLHRVWDTVDPAPGMFDIIVVDEASQCGFEAIPLLYLGKKILIVGDDKQISPDAVGIPRDAVHRLMNEFLYDFKFKASFDVDTSLFDQAKLRYGTSRITLREHFRCMPEIIRFSNNLCYSDTPLIPLRQYPPDRLVPLIHIYVQAGYREGSENRVINRPEAEAIVKKVVELCRDDKYKGKTMGVVILQGEAQAGLIEQQLLNQLGAKEMEQRRLICGNPYSFQGDERDIMFLSMVAAPNERIGPMTMSSDERRFNVAASRARDQMWLFHSLTCDDLSNACLRRRLLEFFEETKLREIAGINIQELVRKVDQSNRSIEKPPQPFDSWFELDVAIEIAGKNYRVVPQYEIAGKYIDLVVEGGHTRLAIECDGDEFHGAECYERDMQRQRMLERCGLVFYRIRASEFYINRKEALKRLYRMLEERGIFPQGKETLSLDEQEPNNNKKEINIHISDSNDVLKTITNDNKVEVGDTVVYVDVESPDTEMQALITHERSNPEWGVINVDTPIAQALLDSSLGDIIEAKLPVGRVRLLIKQIKKKRA